MSYLKTIQLTQFRNFGFANFEFHAPVVAICGLNGMGKTNLLDAIYYTCYTKSNFQNKEINNVQQGKDGFRIESYLTNARNENELIICVWKDGKKNISCNRLSYEKMIDHISKYSAVMVTPDDISIINGGSEGRRKLIDALLAQEDKFYLQNLLSYQQYLYQKNAYLKQNNKDIRYDLLDVYDEQLAIHGSYMIEQRLAFAAHFPLIIQKFYAGISQNNESAGVSYRPSVMPNDLLGKLHEYRQRDIEIRRTSIGPHTEDWHFFIQDKALKTHASQGQKKSYLLALKLSILHQLQQAGKKPFLLLDDIFEKLDAKRMNNFFEMLPNFRINQIFLTHTDKKDLIEYGGRYFNQLQIVEL